MKTKIEIILGLLESGKTHFINSMLMTDEVNNEKIVIIQDESGQTDINASLITDRNIDLVLIDNDIDTEIDNKYLENIIYKHSPDRIFIESNGMKNSNDLISIFEDKNIKKLCKLDDVISIIDAETFSIYYRNMKDLLTSHIVNSSKIIFNNLNILNKKKSINIIGQIKNINESASLLEHSISSDNNDLHNSEKYIELNNSFNFKSYVYIFLIISAFTIISILSISDSNSMLMTGFQNFYTIFVSILIESMPFILLGSFISALIQIYISQDKIMKIFPRNVFLSCIIAAFAGLILPICDCGIIPIAKGLIKKKIPVAACITFMLSAPIVNPIAIISTIYAFQEKKSVVICRVGCGIIISILTGLAIHFCTKNKQDILNNDNINDISICNCSICNKSYNSSDNRFDKIRNVFLHTGDEFFNIGKFMIIGTLLSSIFQSIAYSFNNLYIPNDNRSSLIIMMFLAFLLSVCSTSDAFIAKGFLSSFSLNSTIGFLVFGPMLDIKNTFILFGNFKKKFVLKLIFFIVSISFIVLININLS